jgi:hypothetical protein
MWKWKYRPKVCVCGTELMERAWLLESDDRLNRLPFYFQLPDSLPFGRVSQPARRNCKRGFLASNVLRKALHWIGVVVEVVV